MRETRNLLNLHLFFYLRISAKSWTAFCRPVYGRKNSKNSKPPESPLAFLFEDFRQKLDHLLPRPDSSELHHPPPSLADCGPAETGEIFRAVGGVLQDQVAPETR